MAVPTHVPDKALRATDTPSRYFTDLVICMPADAVLVEANSTRGTAESRPLLLKVSAVSVA